MLRSAASKVMGVGRATVFLVGLAVILALVFGVASMAFAANGKPFILGRNNVASAVSTLIKQGPGPALSLRVQSGQPPLRVNSSGKVANLNADKLDGKDADQIGVNGLVQVSAASGDNSASPKSVSVGCPAGKALVWSGYDLVGGKSGVSPNTQSSLVVDLMTPLIGANGFATGVQVEAYENEPTSGNWQVAVFATCATAP